jgi:hypothetical protein
VAIYTVRLNPSSGLYPLVSRTFPLRWGREREKKTVRNGDVILLLNEIPPVLSLACHALKHQAVDPPERGLLVIMVVKPDICL